MRPLERKTRVTRPLSAGLAAAALLALVSCASDPPPPPAGYLEPLVDIDPSRHGNLAAAQRYVREAYDRISDAQRANDGQLGGHAARAKDILRQVNVELRLAADVANRR